MQQSKHLNKQVGKRQSAHAQTCRGLQQLSASTRRLLQLLLPNHCLICENHSPEALCQHCAKLVTHAPERCQCCALALENSGAEFCPECLQGTHNFDLARCALDYDNLVPNLIRQFKQHEQLTVGLWLCKQLLREINTETLQVDAIVATPQHWTRRLQRGFNQSEYIARYLAKQLALPLLPLLKQKHRQSQQKRLKRHQRLRHKQGVQLQQDIKKGLRIAVVDDVITTAATANEICALLKQAGAGRIEVWALARTPQRHT